MATLHGKITDVTHKPPETLSSITVKAPSVRVGGGTDLIVSSPATVDFDRATGDVTVSGLTGGLSWLHLEGEGWSDSIALSAAEGMATLVEAIANASGVPGMADYLAMIRSSGDHARELARAAVEGEFGEIVRLTQSAATIAAQAATSADTRATSAENKVDAYTPRVDALEAMGGLSPESPVDGQTANLISQSGTLTRKAIKAETDKRVHLFEAEEDTDITEALNTLIGDGGKHIKIQNGTFWVDAGTGIRLQNDTVLEFSPKTVLKAIPNNLTNYVVLRLRDIQNVKIINPVLVGERYEHTGTTGEYGMGIDMRGVTNVDIYNPVCTDFWGDGIYIAESSYQMWCEDVRIYNPVCDGNRRQGISLISAKNLLIDNPILRNTSGVRPQAGLDIEPNYPQNFLENIRINNMHVENNAGSGVALTLGQMAESGKYVDIIINGITAWDNTAFRTAAGTGKLDGHVTVKDIVGVRSGVQIRNYGVNFPHINLENVSIIDPNEGGQTAPIYGSAFAVIAQPDDTNADPIGNVTVKGLEVVDTRPAKQVIDAIHVWDASNTGIPIENVNIIDPVRLDRTRSGMASQGAGTIVDSHGSLTRDMGALDRGVTPSSVSSVFHNATSTTLRRLNVYDTLPDGFPSFVVEVRSANRLRIIPNGMVIHTLTTTPGRYIESYDVGAKIELEKRDGALWVKSIVGEWAVEPDPVIP